ncbi:unnamed protein product [Boreogadus saida]
MLDGIGQNTTVSSPVNARRWGSTLCCSEPADEHGVREVSERRWGLACRELTASSEAYGGCFGSAAEADSPCKSSPRPGCWEGKPQALSQPRRKKEEKQTTFRLFFGHCRVPI